MYSCHLFLISFASVRSLQFLSFIMPIFVQNVPLVSPILLRISLVFPILSFPLFLCIVHLRRPSYISLLFSGILHSVGYIFPFLPCRYINLKYPFQKESNCKPIKYPLQEWCNQSPPCLLRNTLTERLITRTDDISGRALWQVLCPVHLYNNPGERPY